MHWDTLRERVQDSVVMIELQGDTFKGSVSSVLNEGQALVLCLINTMRRVGHEWKPDAGAPDRVTVDAMCEAQDLGPRRFAFHPLNATFATIELPQG